MNKIKVLIVDDSAVMRKFLSSILSRSNLIEVVGTALDPYIAANKINRLKPDLITLDIEMPGMDGLTFLSKIMVANPMPVIMVSSHTENGANSTIKALELGAVDFILKPSLKDDAEVAEFSHLLIDKIKGVGRVKVKNRIPAKSSIKVEQKYSADVILNKKDPVKIKTHSEKIIAIGASTGGTEVIDVILTDLSDDLPGIVITQHMPEKFTKAFADRVNLKSDLHVKEAEHGDRIYKGMALIAPGGKHMLVRCDSSGYWTEINDGPPVNRHKPSVDVLFRSVSQCAGKAAIGIICTGMGDDGAAGLLEMKEAAALTIAQNEQSCVVFGMPKEAIRLGAVDYEADVSGIINYINNFSNSSLILN